MTIWIIDDNADMRASWMDVIADANPTAIVKQFGSFREAVTAGLSWPDVAIVDMTAVSGSQFYQCVDHMRPFLDRHPGCLWVIASAFGKLAEQYFEDYEGPAVVRVIDCADSESLSNSVREATT